MCCLSKFLSLSNQMNKLALANTKSQEELIVKENWETFWKFSTNPVKSMELSKTSSKSKPNPTTSRKNKNSSRRKQNFRTAPFNVMLLWVKRMQKSRKWVRFWRKRKKELRIWPEDSSTEPNRKLFPIGRCSTRNHTHWRWCRSSNSTGTIWPTSFGRRTFRTCWRSTATRSASSSTRWTSTTRNWVRTSRTPRRRSTSGWISTTTACSHEAFSPESESIYASALREWRSFSKTWTNFLNSSRVSRSSCSQKSKAMILNMTNLHHWTWEEEKAELWWYSQGNWERTILLSPSISPKRIVWQFKLCWNLMRTSLT